MTETIERTFVVHIAEEHYAVLDELACRLGHTLGEVLRDAVGHEKWLRDSAARGATLMIQENGETREFWFP